MLRLLAYFLISICPVIKLAVSRADKQCPAVCYAGHNARQLSDGSMAAAGTAAVAIPVFMPLPVQKAEAETVLAR